MKKLLLTVLLLVASLAQAQPYEATWESLDTRPNPQWFEDAKFGIFIHWGVYSVPAWAPKDAYAEWYWDHLQKADGETRKFHDRVYGPDFKYQDFAPMFRAELFEPDQWADIFVRSGAKYVVLTSKHHEGYCLWPSKEAPNWNAVEVGPKRDLAGDLLKAVREKGLRMGFYYSIYEWYNPVYLADVNQYVDQIMLPQLKDLVVRYQPDLIWPDGEWSHPSETWRSTEYLAWLFNESPAPKDVVINDRWGKECRNEHGGFATPEYGHIPKGKLMDEARFEECQGMGKSFGYNRNEDVDSYRTAKDLLHLLIDNVSRGGNLLLDIGPTADGRIPVIMQQRLIDMGQWLKVNGEAIYGTDRWAEAPQSRRVKYTQKADAVYAIALKWPGDTLKVSVPEGANRNNVTLLGYDQPLKVKEKDGEFVIQVPPLTIDQLPCAHAWVFKIER